MSGVTTFMFTDLVDSTRLLATLGEHVAESLRRRYFALLRTAVASNRGREVKSLGDGLMVAFASPSAAVDCAVAIQRAIARHNRTGGERLEVRIGVQVGESSEDDEAGDYFGGPVVQAKRICDAARGGQVLVSGFVRALATRSAHVFDPVEPLRLKGWPEEIAAFEVRYDAAASRPVPPELLDRAERRGVFVGRNAERERLRRIWAEVAGGRRRVAFVCGEPGIGKTRFAAEFALWAHADGATVLWGRSSEDALVPYQPFVQALRHHVVSANPDALAEELGHGAGALARLVPELQERLPAIPAPGVEPVGERHRLFEAMSHLLLTLSADAPLLLVLDDLQWADRATLVLARNLALDPRPASVLILATYRDIDVSRSHPLAELQADLRRDRLLERIQLPGLAGDEVARLLDALSRGALPRTVAGRLEAETAGNPFFLEEVVQHLDERGLLAEPERLARLGAAHLGVPEGVRELVGRRLERLSPEAFRALAVGSVIGADFDLDVLARVLDADEARLVEFLDDAVGARLLVEAPDRVGRYAFPHALIQQTLYEEQTANRRAALHARVAEAMEDLHRADVDDCLAELAHHFSKAADRWASKVVAYGHAAGRRALALLAYEDAAGEFARALAALTVSEPENRALRAELLLDLGTAQLHSGETSTARASFQEAADISRAIGDAATLARAALAYGGGAGVGGIWAANARVDPVLVGLLEDALERVPAGEAPRRARLLGRLGQALYWTPDRERVLALSSEALAAARAGDDRAALAYALDSRHAALFGPDGHEERRAIAEEMLRLGLELGDRDIQLEAHALLIADTLEREPIQVVDRHVAAHARLAAELRDPYHGWYAEVMVAMRALMDGRFQEAELRAAAAWSRGEQPNRENAWHVYRGQTFLIQRDLGRLEATVDEVRAFALEAAPQTWCACLALLLSELGRDEEALEEVAQLAADGLSRVRRDCLWGPTVAMLAQAVVRLGAVEHAAALYEALLPSEDGNIPAAVMWMGPTSRFLGILAGLAGDHERALAHLSQALERATVLGWRPLQTRTRIETASVLLSRGAEGDRARALRLLDEAEEVARELDMAGVLRDLAELRVRATRCDPAASPASATA